MKPVLMLLLLVNGGVEHVHVTAHICAYTEMTLASGAEIRVEGASGTIEVEGVLCINMESETDKGPVS